MKHALLIAISQLICVVPLAAHQDTPIQLKDGKLLGLPKEFEPAAFDLEKKILTISGKALKFPDSLQALFPDDRPGDQFGEPNPVEGVPFDLKFSGSWYHGPSLLPPYLLISITPNDRDFRSEILIDIESITFLKAHLILRVSDERTEVVPILIEKPKPPKRPADDWLSILGKWRSGPFVVEITKTSIKTTLGGEPYEYPNGKISPKEPGVMTIETTDGAKEIFVYVQMGDILELSFERATGVGLARLGSPADKAYQRRNEDAEQGSTGQPATRPELKSEFGDKPQPEAEVRSR